MKNNVVKKITFWKDSNIIAKRLVRNTIRNNYKTAKLIFFGFFGKIRETNKTDYENDKAMILSKTVSNIDKNIIKKSIHILKQHGFDVGVYTVKKNVYIVTMTPNKIYMDFNNDYILKNGKVNGNEYLNKIKILFDFIEHKHKT